MPFDFKLYSLHFPFITTHCSLSYCLTVSLSVIVSSPSNDTAMEVIKHKEETLFDEFFEVRRGVLQFEKFDGSLSPEVTRYSFAKWDAVAILVYHTEKD